MDYNVILGIALAVAIVWFVYSRVRKERRETEEAKRNPPPPPDRFPSTRPKDPRQDPEL